MAEGVDSKEEKADLSEEDAEENAQNCEIVIEDGTKEEFSNIVYDTSESNGWFRKFRDYDCYQKMKADDFKFHHYAAKTKGGCYVGSCICIEDGTVAMLSIYYVASGFRGRGIGKQLLEKTFDEKLKKKNIGVYTVTPANPLCGKVLNFTKKADWKIAIVTLKNVDMEKIKAGDDKEDKKLTVKSVRDVPFEDLVEYDRGICNYERKSFLKNWVYDRYDCVAKVVLDESNKIIGYGSARLLSIATYPALSPIYCDNDSVFLRIIKDILICFPEEMEEKKQICLWVPTVNIDKLKSITKGICSVEKGTEYSVEFTKQVPKVDIARVYGISETMMLI